jgi:hypothetical protein
MGKESEEKRELRELSVSVLLVFRKEEIVPKKKVEDILRTRNEVPKDEFSELHKGRGCKVVVRNLGTVPKPINIDPEVEADYIDFYQLQLFCGAHNVTSETFELQYPQMLQLKEEE